METHINLNNKLMKLYEEYAQAVINSRWEDIEDWWIETSCFGAEIGNVMLSVNDMWWILEYKIPKTIVYEWRDMRTQGHYSDRVKQAIKDTKGEHKDYEFKEFNLVSFYRYFKS
jgi:hypothetical protein